MTPEIFSSKAQFRHIFEQGLVQLLDYDELGIFILVLANASFDQHVHDYTNKALQKKHHQLADKYRSLLQDGQLLTEAPDDIMVFLKLMAMGGIDKISQTEFRHVHHNNRQWELQFNHIRSLRPARMSQNVIEGIFLDFNPDGFHFNKPFLQKECYWSGTLYDRKLQIFYNKFPFARFHSLLIPDAEKCLPQYLKRDYHQYIWQLTAQLGKLCRGSAWLIMPMVRFLPLIICIFTCLSRITPYRLWNRSGSTTAAPKATRWNAGYLIICRRAGHLLSIYISSILVIILFTFLATCIVYRESIRELILMPPGAVVLPGMRPAVVLQPLITASFWIWIIRS